MPRTRAARHESDHGSWESVRREPDPRLHPYIHGWYHGWVERAPQPVRRQECPFPAVPVILNLGPPFRLIDPARPTEPGAPHDSFVAGLHESYALVESATESLCIQVDFTPIGAHLFFHLPMNTLAGRVVGLSDVLGPATHRVIERLHDAPDWETRFAILDAVILSRVAAARPASPGIAWAWRRLTETDGRVDIGTLAADVGWSRKHLIDRFREQIGLPPKRVARILRFNHAIRLLDALLDGSPGTSWSRIAHRCGYYDQAHLIRDFRQFTGGTPTAYVRRLLPGGGGVAGDSGG